MDNDKNNEEQSLSTNGSGQNTHAQNVFYTSNATKIIPRDSGDTSHRVKIWHDPQLNCKDAGAIVIFISTFSYAGWNLLQKHGDGISGVYIGQGVGLQIYLLLRTLYNIYHISPPIRLQMPHSNAVVISENTTEEALRSIEKRPLLETQLRTRDPLLKTQVGMTVLNAIINLGKYIAIALMPKLFTNNAVWAFCWLIGIYESHKDWHCLQMVWTPKKRLSFAVDDDTDYTDTFQSNFLS